MLGLLLLLLVVAGQHVMVVVVVRMVVVMLLLLRLVAVLLLLLLILLLGVVMLRWLVLAQCGRLRAADNRIYTRSLFVCCWMMKAHNEQAVAVVVRC